MKEITKYTFLIMTLSQLMFSCARILSDGGKQNSNTFPRPHSDGPYKRTNPTL